VEKANKNKEFIHSLEKGIAILQALSKDQFEMSLSQVARATEMSFGTVHRYLSTLVTLGYVDQVSMTKKYHLTSRVLELGFAVLKNMDLRRRVLPYLIEVAREFDVTTGCSILDGHEIVYIERVRSTNLVHLDLSPGSRLPAHCTSMGKALLAFQEKDHLKTIIEKMELTALTPHTITNKQKLKQELETIRKRGYATCREELGLGVESIAAPIFKSGEVEAAIAFNLPNLPVSRKNEIEKALVQRLLELCRRLSMG
jgi:IclR family pca regulon transcriptional regulator